MTKEKWVVVLPASSPKVGIDNPTDYHFDSKIHTHIKLYDDDDVWRVPLTSLVTPYYVIFKKSCCDSNIVDNRYICDATAHIVCIMNKRGDTFLQLLDN